MHSSYEVSPSWHALSMAALQLPKPLSAMAFGATIVDRDLDHLLALHNDLILFPKLFLCL